jgi:hypothetical protein
MPESLIDSCLGSYAIANLRCEKEFVTRLVAALLAKRFVILTGLAGSGKTKVAQAFARWMTPNNIIASNPFVPGAKIPSANITYFVKAADHLAVEFWNGPDEKNAIKVVLPRALIQEWVDYISANQISADVQARQIREAVNTTTKYSSQLNSFETIFKAAAFASLNAPLTTNPCRCYELVSVGADWTNNEHVLGYPDGLDKTRYVRTKILDLILRAHDTPEFPHFLILDEMNLSHVERYFADLLSAFESDEPLSLHSDKDADGSPAVRDGVPGEVNIPPNLFIIGTVNVDETTYMFSPKVLDRANVIEFRATADGISDFLKSPAPVDMEALAGKGTGYGRAFVNAARTNASLAKLPPEICDSASTGAELQQRLTELFVELAPIGAEFGFRTAFEISRFFFHHAVLTGPGWQFKDAMDAQVVQKLMPKLHGSDRKLRPTLVKLKLFCEAHDLKLSLAKTNRMLERLSQDGFTSFAEA